MQKAADIPDPVEALRSEYERNGWLGSERLKVLERLKGDERMQDVWLKFSLNLQDDIPPQAISFILKRIATAVVNIYEIINDRAQLLEKERVLVEKTQTQVSNARSLSEFIRDVMLFRPEDLERFKSSDRANVLQNRLATYNNRISSLSSELEWVAIEIESRIPSYQEYLNPFQKAKKERGQRDLH